MIFRQFLKMQISRLVLLHKPANRLLPIATIQAARNTSTAQKSAASVNLELMRREQARRDRLSRVSEAMMLYMDKRHAREQLLEEQKLEFERGKRHLANIMGFDAETMTKRQIDASIKYLFPSGLTEPRAMPQMKLPQFRGSGRDDVDQNGWPKHTLYYTCRPKFFAVLSDINRRTLRLVQEYDARQLAFHRGEISAKEAKAAPLAPGYTFPIEKLRGKVSATGSGSDITDDMYASMIMALEYMAQLPNASLEEPFIRSFASTPMSEEEREKFAARRRKPLLFHNQQLPAKICIIPRTISRVKGNIRQATATSMVKATRAWATVTAQGTGKITVDGHHYDVFQDLQAREILLSPMIMTGLLGKIDIDARVQGAGGRSATPRAIRHATSLALAALYPELGERLRLAGLLNADLRQREREKINQKGARAKWIWKKR